MNEKLRVRTEDMCEHGVPQMCMGYMYEHGAPQMCLKYHGAEKESPRLSTEYLALALPLACAVKWWARSAPLHFHARQRNGGECIRAVLPNMAEIGAAPPKDLSVARNGSTEVSASRKLDDLSWCIRKQTRLLAQAHERTQAELPALPASPTCNLARFP